MKSLILYYSYRGNTQRIAERIHSAIGGDIARIDTVVPYTGSYDDVVAQGEREVKRGFLPELKAMDIDLEPLRHDRARHARLVVHLRPGHARVPDRARPQRQDRLSLRHERRLARPHDSRTWRALCPGADVKPGLDVHFDDTTLRTPDKTIDRWIAAIHD